MHALQDVDLAVPRGGAVALVGESGSGKSTFVLAMLGLLGRARVTARRMVFDGLELEPRKLRGRRIAAVFQDPSSSLNPALTVGAQVAEPLVVHGRLSARVAREQAAELLAEVGLPRPGALLGAYPHQLSGGMKQRVAIATALAARPDLLLLDEPTTALDVTVEAGILDLLAGLRARLGLSLVLVSHNLGIVDRLCERAVVLYAGRVVEDGTVREVLDAPLHPYPRGLLAALPRVDRVGPLAPIPGGLPDMRRPDPGCNFRPRCPFAAPGCEAPQALTTGPHRVRCHRADDIVGLGGPRLRMRGRVCLGRACWSRLSISQEIRRGAGGAGRVAHDRTRRGAWASGRVRLRQVDAGLAAAAATACGCGGRAVRGRGDRPGAGPAFPAPGWDRAAEPGHCAEPAAFGWLRAPAAASAFWDRVRGGRGAGSYGAARACATASEYAARYPHQLSGGEKQRVAIARALASRPDFLVCDEAVSALDVSVQAATLNLLAGLRDTLGLALLFISHDIGVVAHLSDRIAVMYGGAVMELGPAAAVLRPPFHPYTEALLSAVPAIGLRRGRVRLEGEPGAVPPGDGCRFATRCPRRLGPICDSPPPIRTLGEGHWARCHIEAADLSALQTASGTLATV